MESTGTTSAFYSQPRAHVHCTIVGRVYVSLRIAWGTDLIYVGGQDVNLDRQYTGTDGQQYYY
jgi:hypothetical protein